MAVNELERFISEWDREAESTLKLLRALPSSQYDFRPDAGGRSLGELAWHLAEGDAYMSAGIEAGQFSMDPSAKPPNIERPRTVEALAPGYERVHREAVARIRKLKPEDLDRSIPFFSGPMPIRDILRNNVKEKLARDEVVASMTVRLVRGIEIARIARTAGFDSLYVDLEHSSFSLETCGQICMAALEAGIAPFVRVPANTPEYVTRVLEGGALGVIAPHIRSAQEAREVVKAARFPPLGERSNAVALTACFLLTCWAFTMCMAEAPLLLCEMPHRFRSTIRCFLCPQWRQSLST